MNELTNENLHSLVEQLTKERNQKLIFNVKFSLKIFVFKYYERHIQVVSILISQQNICCGWVLMGNVSWRHLQ